MKRKIALALVLVIISALLLTGCPIPFLDYPGFTGSKSVSDVEDIYNNYLIGSYLVPDDVEEEFSNILEYEERESYPEIFKSVNEDSFHEAVQKCDNLQDLGFTYYTGIYNKSSNALFISIYDLDAMAYLLDNGADPNTADNSVTPLMFCANLGQKPICDLLLEHGADINLAGKYGLRPLDCALISGCGLDFIQYLVEKGATVDAMTLDAALYGDSGEGTMTTLSFLFLENNIYNFEDAYCRYENVRYILQILLESGQQTDMDPALQAAIMGDSAEVKKILKKNGEKISTGEAIIPTEIDASDVFDEEYIQIILEMVDEAISGPLDQYNLSKIEDVLDKILHKFSKDSDTEEIEAEQSKRNFYLNQLLFNVAAFGNLKDMEDIMENGSKQFLGITNGLGLDLMSVAIQYNNMENVKYLEETFHFHTDEALKYAVYFNNIDAAKYLMERGGKLTDSNTEENEDNIINDLPLACLKAQYYGSSLTWGAEETLSQQSEKCIAMLEFLKQYNYSYKDSGLDKAITFAVEKSDQEVLEYLLKNYGTPQLAKNALNIGADVDTVKLLLQYGADILKTNKGAEYVGSAAE